MQTGFFIHYYIWKRIIKGNYFSNRALYFCLGVPTFIIFYASILAGLSPENYSCERFTITDNRIFQNEVFTFLHFLSHLLYSCTSVNDNKIHRSPWRVEINLRQRSCPFNLHSTTDPLANCITDGLLFWLLSTRKKYIEVIRNYFNVQKL